MLGELPPPSGYVHVEEHRVGVLAVDEVASALGLAQLLVLHPAVGVHAERPFAFGADDEPPRLRRCVLGEALARIERAYRCAGWVDVAAVLRGRLRQRHVRVAVLVEERIRGPEGAASFVSALLLEVAELSDEARATRVRLRLDGRQG